MEGPDTYPHCNATRADPRPATCHEIEGHDGDHRWLPDEFLSQMFRVDQRNPR